MGEETYNEDVYLIGSCELLFCKSGRDISSNILGSHIDMCQLLDMILTDVGKGIVDVIFPCKS